jgi:hypothetical protein
MIEPRKPGRPPKSGWKPSDIIKARQERIAAKYAEPESEPDQADSGPLPFEPVYDGESEQLELPFVEPEFKLRPPDSDPPTPAADQIAELLAFVKGIAAKQADQDKRLAQLAKRPAKIERPGARSAARAEGEDVVYDRQGNIVTRRAQRSLDPFELPEEFMIAQRADDYTSEWKSFRVLNMDMDAYINDLYNDGWTPVKNSRIPGRYGGEEEEPVIHQGMMLMERPAGLTRKARREQELASREQVNSRKRDWGVDERRKRVFDPEGRFSENLNRIRSTVEQAPAFSYPDLEIASGDEL